MDEIKERFKIFFIGLFTIILLLEVSLRIIGSIHEKKVTSGQISLSGARRSHYVILFLGDSFTLGMGAPYEKNMPNQLQAMLDSKLQKKFIKVINLGKSSYNTAQVLNKLDYNIDTIKPDLIILLIGGANAWNYWGYRTYLEGKNLFSILHDQLYKICVYKLVKLLFLSIKSKIKNDLSVRQSERDLRDYNKALEYFKEGIRVNPKDSGNYFGMGMACKEHGYYNKALEYFKEGIRVNPKDSRNYNGMGMVYKERGYYNKALEYFKEGIRVNPKDSGSYNGMGMVYKELGYCDKALEYFKEGIRVNPKDSSSYFGIGRAYIEMRDCDKALEYFKEGIRVNPKDSSSYFGIGMLYRDLRDYDKALEYFKEGIIDNYQGIMKNYGKIFTKNVETIEFLRKISEGNPIALDYIEILKKENIYKELTDWIKSDITNIIELCRSKKVKIMLQNYPDDQGRENLNRSIKEISIECSVPFVDNYQVFNKLWVKGERKKGYFSPDGHCNEKGYGVMAKNIYDKIIKEKLINLN